MGEKQNSYKNKKDMLCNGAICQEYGSKYLLSINPAYEINRCRWSVVDIGSKGENKIDFYMSMDDMRRFCDDVVSGACKPKFMADMNDNYPSAYQYTTGQNGCKKLSIGGGKKGIRINASIKTDDNKPFYKSTSISWAALLDIAFYFQLVMGLKPVQGGYYGYLKDVYWEGVRQRAEAHNAWNSDFNESDDGSDESENAASYEDESFVPFDVVH